MNGLFKLHTKTQMQSIVKKYPPVHLPIYDCLNTDTFSMILSRCSGNTPLNGADVGPTDKPAAIQQR